MKSRLAAPKDIDAYIAGFPGDVQAILQKIRATVQKAAPDAVESISYRMPAFKQRRYLVYFAAFKHHIGFYPPIRGADRKLTREKSIYQGPKGNLQFPLDAPIPYTLISRLVKLKVKQELQKLHSAAVKRRKA